MKNFGDIVSVNDTTGGAYVNMTMPDDTVNVHLMPGKMIVYQNNTDHSFNLSSQIFASGTIDLVANPQDGHATGKGYFDDGDKMSDLQNITNTTSSD
jgi:hypothetical protein